MLLEHRGELVHGRGEIGGYRHRDLTGMRRRQQGQRQRGRRSNNPEGEGGARALGRHAESLIVIPLLNSGKYMQDAA
ncbi:hypothetical protein [Diaphorobacter aerolatus]|uniref:hypothetical protein n=1 Tax=Diaphorobacter aerolatus TaxID=1288495 RepID=UPI001D02DF5B|nr:hypothetical protein [Diaphorobacter aerolatus]